MNAPVSKKKRVYAWIGLGVSLLLIAVLVFTLQGQKDGNLVQELYQVARRGPLVISVSENGEINPSEQITIKSEVEGRVSLLYIIPEGTIVK